MQDNQPLRFSTHANMAWKPSTNYKFASGTPLIPISADELSQAAVNMPLGFSLTAQDVPSLVAIAGLRPEQNLFVGPEGQWAGFYVPAVLRGYPFKLIAAAEGQFALGYDHGSGLLTELGDGEAFFTPEGQPTERVQQILGFLIRLNSGLQRSTSAAALLYKHGLLEPWPIKISNGDDQIPVEGLLRLNEEKLLSLDDASFLSLRVGGALVIAYTQLISMTNIDVLGKLARLHVQHAAMTEKQQEEIKSMFVPTHAEDEIDWDAMLKDDES